MGRPSKLSPAQWEEVERRLAAGEGASDLSREFGVHPSQVTRRVAQKSQKVREVAQKVAEAQTALAELPVAQQYSALSLAETISNVMKSSAKAAELGAKTAHRLQALANTEAAKIDDANPGSSASEASLRTVAMLTKVANEAAATGMGLISVTKDRMAKAEEAERQAGVTAEPLRPQLTREQWLKTHGLA
jgi:hypothetical protein